MEEGASTVMDYGSFQTDNIQLSRKPRSSFFLKAILLSIASVFICVVLATKSAISSNSLLQLEMLPAPLVSMLPFPVEGSILVVGEFRGKPGNGANLPVSNECNESCKLKCEILYKNEDYRNKRMKIAACKKECLELCFP
uniref:Uncharacterized protein n=1 Tax=Cryptomonas curvata TaxID=233186 RepID=A0A7S0QNN3_9CRYP|mmetsp:Transcript_39372/g.82444  ORF Transcript_39372/g.82444 Transcript_39372/m.82444 type:complete len:140 (+) Transcript_39372:1-420(+)